MYNCSRMCLRQDLVILVYSISAWCVIFVFLWYKEMGWYSDTQKLGAKARHKGGGFNTKGHCLRLIKGIKGNC